MKKHTALTVSDTANKRVTVRVRVHLSHIYRLRRAAAAAAAVVVAAAAASTKVCARVYNK